MIRCSYERFARTHGHPVERCAYEAEPHMPYCGEHLERVAWLSLGWRRTTVPGWLLVVIAFVLCSALCGGGSP